MESDEQSELTRKMGTDSLMENRMTAIGVEGVSKKEKGLMDTDNGVVITGGREYKGA